MKTDSEQSGCSVVKKKQGKAPESGRGSREDDYSFVLPHGFLCIEEWELDGD